MPDPAAVSPPADDAATAEVCQKCQTYPDGTVYRTRCICPEPMTSEQTLRAVAGLGGSIGDAVRDLLAEVERLRAVEQRTREIESWNHPNQVIDQVSALQRRAMARFIRTGEMDS